MDDYISLEAVLEFAKDLVVPTKDGGIYRHRCIDPCDIRTLPAADVKPVVHGHYVGEYDGYADGSPVYDMWYCSVCGCYFEEWDEQPTYNFCPNCGARMDGDG